MATERDKFKQKLEQALQDGWDCGDYDDILEAATDVVEQERRAAAAEVLAAAYNILYQQAPTGDISAWDAIKAFQAAQKDIEQLAKKLKDPAHQPGTGKEDKHD